MHGLIKYFIHKLVIGQIDLQSQQGRRLLLSLCKDVANGLAHLHQVKQIPTDLGARTCQITSQLIVKVRLDCFSLCIF